MKVLLIGTVFMAMAVADSAPGAERRDGREAPGLLMTSPAEPAAGADAVDGEGLPEAIDDRDPDGTSTLAAAQADDDPDGDHAARGDDGARAAGPHLRWKGRAGENAAPAAQGESAQARAPPARVPSTATGPGA